VNEELEPPLGDAASNAGGLSPGEVGDDVFAHHLALIGRVQSDPENRPCADKTWVDRAMRDYREHYRRAERVE
jgi:hypothetical protein